MNTVHSSTLSDMYLYLKIAINNSQSSGIWIGDFNQTHVTGILEFESAILIKHM
jgi:hypothetical protein